jgi:hypothetical protein
VPADTFPLVHDAGPPSAIYFCVDDRSRNIRSYAWRVGWSRKSFYIKARYAPLAALKVSLHGPDPRHGRPGFKVAVEESAMECTRTAGGVVGGTPDWLPRWFDGREVTADVRHVVRFRHTWDLYAAAHPTAPNPGEVKPSAVAAVIPAPPPLSAVDVDVYVARRRPYWPKERRARSDNACLGPLTSEAGEHLTAVAVRRRVADEPTPQAAHLPRPAKSDDYVRAVGATVDGAGVLWICEQWMSRAAAETGAT